LKNDVLQAVQSGAPSAKDLALVVGEKSLLLQGAQGVFQSVEVLCWGLELLDFRRHW